MIRSALQPIAANLPGNDFCTLQQIVDTSVSPRPFLVMLLGGFGMFLGMVVVLTFVALVAGYLAARRASRVDPMVALRAE